MNDLIDMRYNINCALTGTENSLRYVGNIKLFIIHSVSLGSFPEHPTRVESKHDAATRSQHCHEHEGGERIY